MLRADRVDPEGVLRALGLTLLLVPGACAGTASDTRDEAETDVPADSDSDGAAPDTWESFAAEFFVSYCVECHDSPPRDFTNRDDVATNADTIRCGVATEVLDGCGAWPPPEQFPVGSGPAPTADERERLVAWIDAGMP